MTHSMIQKSQLEGSQRIDAEYYQPEFLEVNSNLAKWLTMQLKDFCRIADGDHSAIPGFVDTGVRYLRAKDLKNFFIDNSDPVYISNDYFEKLKRSHIKPNDIVLSIMGTLGNLAVILPNSDIMTANRAVSIISPKSQNIFSSSFIACFLESKFGVLQRERDSMGGVQQRVNLDDLEKIEIPKIPKNKQIVVDRIFTDVVKLNDESIDKLQNAENLLLEELGLKDFEEKNDLFSIINLSDVQKTNRIDAEYFQPKFFKLFEIITKNHQIDSLGKIAKIQRGSSIDPKYYSESGKQYIRGADFSDGRIDSLKAAHINNNFCPKNETVVKANDIVYASIGSVGNLVIVDPAFSDSFISNNLALLRVIDPNKIIPEYLFVILRSIIGQSLFDKESSQTAQPKISDSQVRNFTIPVLPKSTQQKIADLVKQSFIARQKSKELLNEAKREVEEMIEKGGE